MKSMFVLKLLKFISIVSSLMFFSGFYNPTIGNAETTDEKDTAIILKKLRTIIVDNYFPYTFLNKEG